MMADKHTIPVTSLDIHDWNFEIDKADMIALVKRAQGDNHLIKIDVRAHVSMTCVSDDGGMHDDNFLVNVWMIRRVNHDGK